MPGAAVLEAIAFIRGLQASPITRTLSQGSAPPYGRAVADAGFDVLILCASEFQPPAKLFPGVRVIHCDIDDAPMSQEIWTRARSAAQEAAACIQRGDRVLSTCAFGWNRSGLVDAMIQHEVEGISGAEAVRRIRAKQPGALTNASFVRALKAVPAIPRRSRSSTSK